MAVHPTRFMNRNTPLDMMTVDQMLFVHGPQPIRKYVPPRPLGPPRSREEVQGAQAAERLYGEQAQQARPVYSEVRPVTVGITPIQQQNVGIDPVYQPPDTKPKARLKPLLVSPTDPSYDGAWTAQPCRDVMEMEIEVEGVGIVVYPIECEIKGGHPNQPHMARVPGSSPDPQRNRLDVFVGWADER